MKNNTNKISAAFITIYILIAAFFFGSLFYQYNKNSKQSVITINNIIRSSSDILTSKNLTGQQFSEGFSNIVKSNAELKGLYLTSGNRLIFSYPKEFNTQDKTRFTLTKTTQLTDASGNLYNLYITLYLLKPSAIKKNGLISLLMILLFTVILIAFIVTNINLPQKKRPELNVTQFHDTPDEMNGKPDAIEKNEISEGQAAQALPVTEKTQVISENAAEEIKDGNTVISEPVTQSAGSKTDSAAQNAFTENTEIPETKTTSFSEPKDNPPQKSEAIEKNDTSAAEEKAFIEKLQSALHNACCDLNDLALFIIRIPCILWDNEIKTRIDEMFEAEGIKNENISAYKEDGICFFINEMNHSQALSLADRLHIELTSILATAGSEYYIGIGIATRNSRIISAEKLYHEAEQATLKAISDTENPVVAFKVNPQKYRQFLSGTRGV